MSQAQISGAVQSAEGEPLPFVNVLLLSATDSTLVKGEISGDDGTFVLTDLTASDYRLLFSMVGYAEQYSDIFQLSKGQRLTLEPFVLLEDVALLDAVTIKARKPLFEQKIELITTPPSSFDAEGNAGFINIYGDYTHYRDARFLQSECKFLNCNVLAAYGYDTNGRGLSQNIHFFNS